MGGGAAGSPRVTIGLPIYNGEQSLREALESLLTQDFDDVEVVISDNASVDGTPDICAPPTPPGTRASATSADELNLGSIPNFNRLVGLGPRASTSSGRPMTTGASPEFVRRCVEVLDADPGVVLCHAKGPGVDEAGDTMVVRPGPLDVRSTTTHGLGAVPPGPLDAGGPSTRSTGSSGPRPCAAPSCSAATPAPTASCWPS